MRGYNTNIRLKREAQAQVNALVSMQKSVMDSLGQGLILFNKDGVCLPVFSKAAEKMFDAIPSNRHILDLLKISGVERDDLTLWIEFIFKQQIAFSDLEKLGPRHFKNSRGERLDLHFRPDLDAQGNIQNMVMIATDRTVEEIATADLAQKNEYVQRIIQLAKNKDRFKKLVAYSHKVIADCDIVLAEQKTDTETLNELKRSFHTLKGFAGIFHMGQLADDIHNFETQLSEKIRTQKDYKFVLKEASQKLQFNLREFIKEYDFIVGDLASGISDNVEFSRLEFKNFVNTHRASLGLLAVPLIKTTVAKSLYSALSFLQEYADQLSVNLGKKINKIKFVGGETKLLVEPYEIVFSTFVHVISNSLDHGIHLPAERESVGKSPAGTLLFTISESADAKYWQITYEDDGEGIDTPTLRSRLIKSGHTTVADWSDDQVNQSIFISGLSTASKVTLVSGRGVGLSALKSAVEQAGGQVRVESKRNQFCRFHITLPQVWEI